MLSMGRAPRPMCMLTKGHLFVHMLMLSMGRAPRPMYTLTKGSPVCTHADAVNGQGTQAHVHVDKGDACLYTC